MSLPQGIVIDASSNVERREMLLVMTYTVVVCSILMQNSTIAGLIRKSNDSVSQQDCLTAPR